MVEFEIKFKNELHYSWNPQTFDWRDHSYILVMVFSDYFPDWWDPEKFNWYHCYFLAEYCPSYFDIWWNPEKFNWGYCTSALRIYCSQYFQWKIDGYKMGEVGLEEFSPTEIVRLKLEGFKFNVRF